MSNYFEHSKHIEMWNHIIEFIDEASSSNEAFQSLRELRPHTVFELKRKALRKMNINKDIKNLCFGCSYAQKEKFKNKCYDYSLSFFALIFFYNIEDSVNCIYCPFFIDDEEYNIKLTENENILCLNGLFDLFCDFIEIFLDTNIKDIEDIKNHVINIALKIRDYPIKENILTR